MTKSNIKIISNTYQLNQTQCEEPIVFIGGLLSGSGN